MEQLRLPITDFTYDPLTRKFRYRPTGQVWRAGGVNVACGDINVDGKQVKASLWLKCQAALKEIR